MTEKQLEELKEMKEVNVGIYDGCLTVLDGKITDTVLHNWNNTVTFDLKEFEVKGRTAKSIFKDLMTQIIPLIIERFPESKEAQRIEWAEDEGYDLFIDYNCSGRHPYNFRYKLNK